MTLPLICSGLSVPQEQHLLELIEQGLPLTPKPYLSLAQTIGCYEQDVIDTIGQWQEQGLIKRLGLVVLHRKLGYVANAMVVWDVPDEQIEQVAELLSQENAVTLCYRRPRILPQWPYNLFCMIHGKSRDQVLSQLASFCQHEALGKLDKDVLFSTKAYKQRGGKYSARNTGVKHES